MRVRLFVAWTVVLAGVVSAAAVLHWGLPDPGQLAFFWALYGITLLDRIEVRVEPPSVSRNDGPRGVTLSPGFVVLLTAAFATTPTTALAVALIPALPVLLDRLGRDWLKLAFNSAQEAIYVGVAGAAYALVRTSDLETLSSFTAAAIAAVVGLTLNTLFVAGVVAADRGTSWREIVRRMTWTVPHSIAFGLIALMIATLYLDHGPIAAVFLFMPLAALRVARRAKVEVDLTRERTITDFVRVVDAKDPYTSRHSERVAAIAVALHKELGARGSDLESRWTAALLHDVGKVAVPAEILGKPGPLTLEEFDAIKQHPGIGAEAVRDIDLFRDLAPEIEHHHERMDGRGYPAGLVGEAIPMEARVLAVADAFEALTSDRPYRRAKSSSEAMQELARTAGAHHDPTVVEALGHLLAAGVVFARPSVEDGDIAVRHAEAR